jgi:hypothetical protein
MGVTGEIAQHLLGPSERRFAVNDPLDAPQRSDELWAIFVMVSWRPVAVKGA